MAAPHREVTSPRGLFSRPLLALCAFGILVGSLGVTNHELWTADEPRVAAIGRAMWESGDWAVPRLGGEAFLEKPPLYWWSQAAVFELFGRADAGLSRVPSALFCFATLLMTYALGRCFFPPGISLLGGLALLTTLAFVRYSHWIIVDAALLFGTTGSLACFAHSMGRSGSARALLLAGFYACLAVGFLSKGVIALGLPAAGILVYLLWARRLRDFLGWHLVAGGLAIVALIGLWLWRVWLAEGSAGLDAFLLHNQLGRFLPGTVAYEGGHQRPFYYYLKKGPAVLLPWVPLMLLAGVSYWRNRDRLPDDARDGIRLLLSFSLTVLVVLSLAGTKREIYLLPITPTLALFAGWWMGSTLDAPRWERLLERGWRGVVVAAVLLAPGLVVWLDPTRWPYALAAFALLCAVALAMRRLASPDRAEGWLRVLALVSLGWATLLVTAFPAFDAYKTHVPYTDDLEQSVPAGETVTLFRPKETHIGIVTFYTDYPIEIVGSLAELRERVERETPVWLFVRNAKDLKAVQSSGIPYRVVFERRLPPKRTRWLLSLDAAQAEDGATSGSRP